MTCPKCGLINLPTAEHCECGYEFAAVTSTSKDGTQESGTEDGSDDAEGGDPVQAFVDRHVASAGPHRAPLVLRSFFATLYPAAN